MNNSYIFAPYVHVVIWPPFSLMNCYRTCGVKYFTLAFIVGKNNEPTWGGHYPLSSTNPQWFLQEINALRAVGGDVIISFGGASDDELGNTITNVDDLVKAYQTVIDTYKVRVLDFDIEGGTLGIAANVDRRNKAIVKLRENNPNLKIHYTLPVTPSGLDHNGINLLRNAKQQGLIIDLVNIMTMDYGTNVIQMGNAAISAARNTRSQLISLGFPQTKVGICPMIGVNDVITEIFTQENAHAVVQFAKNNDYIGLLTFWSCGRDVAQQTTSNIVSATRSGIIQGHMEFSTIFNNPNGQFYSQTQTPTLPTITQDTWTFLQGKDSWDGISQDIQLTNLSIEEMKQYCINNNIQGFNTNGYLKPSLVRPFLDELTFTADNQGLYIRTPTTQVNPDISSIIETEITNIFKNISFERKGITYQVNLSRKE